VAVRISVKEVVTLPFAGVFYSTINKQAFNQPHSNAQEPPPPCFAIVSFNHREMFEKGDIKGLE
jgi:hypothetical protein